MTFDIQEIMGLLPHRYPFLLIDKVVEFEPQKRLVAIKSVTINEPFFQGHFPGYPIMPGVLVVEAMAQAGGIIMTANVAIGMFTPPFGLNIFVARSVLRVPLETIYRGVLPFVVVQVIALLIITYWPELSLILTRAI